MKLSLWSRAIALALISAVTLSAARPVHVCPKLDQSTHSHHHEAPSHNNQQNCDMMLSCTSAVVVASAALQTSVTASALVPIFEGREYISVLLAHDPPPPTSTA